MRQGNADRYAFWPNRAISLPPIARYGLAVAFAAIAILIRLAFDPLWGVKLPYITLIPAIMASAWLGGASPGIVTTLITGTAAEYFWIEPAGSWAILEKSELLGLLVFVSVGIFISVLNEAWRRGTKAVAESEEQLRVTLTSIGDGVIATDDRGRITRLNDVAERLTGWSNSDAVGRPLDEVFVIINEDTRQRVLNPVQRVLRECTIVGLANHTLLIAKDGREIPIDDSAAPILADGGRLSAAPIKIADGEIRGAVLVFRDVTERRGIERERLKLISDLEAAVRARDDFLSIASHELRNPVNAVHLQLVGILRTLQRGGDDMRPEEMRDRVGQASAQVVRLTRLLDNLLDVSRSSAGSIVLEPEDVDLTEVVNSVIDQFQGESAPGQITLRSRPSVVGQWDRLRAEQIVSNVLSNAIKYGNGQPIVISVDADDRAAHLTVKDHGIGIAPEQHERLFTRFERGVSRRQYGGFGLGLWITRQLVDAMGGRISVDSRPGQGATFSIVLPLCGVETTGKGTSN